MEREIKQEIPVYSRMPDCDGMYTVHGDSMVPALYPGDIVCYKINRSSHKQLLFGEMYLLRFTIDGDEYTAIKRIYQSKTAGYYTLESNNPNHAPKDIPIHSITTLAQIKASIRIHSI